MENNLNTSNNNTANSAANNAANSIDNKLNAARDSVTAINKDLRADAHTAIDKVADKVPPATDRLATRAHNGVDAVADTVKGVSDSVSGVADTAVARGKQLSAAYQQFADTGRDYVRTSPAISVLLAAAAGYGLSKLLGSRK